MFPFDRLAGLASARLNGLPPLQLQVPAWSTGELDAVVWSDVFGADVPVPLTRASALRIPAVARARHLLAGTVARLPLVALRRDQVLPPEQQPGWLYASDGQLGTYGTSEALGLTGGQSVWSRMLGTVDDFLFYGGSLWLTTQRDATGRPARMVRLPFDRWYVDDAGAYVDADYHPLEVDQADLVYLPGPHEGILCFGAATLRQALTLEATAADIAQHPLRLELHQTTDSPMTDGQIYEMVAAARRAMTETGGVLYTNSAMETKDHLVSSGDLLVAARNAVAVDVSRHAGIPASMLDASGAGASLTYETAQTKNLEFVDYGISLYSSAVQARLSMDDILPIGQRVAFDLGDLTAIPPSATGPTLED